MVYATRRATVKVGKIQEAINWAKEIAEFINNKYNTNFGVYTQMLGESPISTIFWVGKLDSIVNYLELVEKLNQDEDYARKLVEASMYLVDGMTYDSVLLKH